ncbi:MAG: hypothetical protein JWM82_2488, partial [Myxococcales bacterium]|nr:hypothetical protein [Myxococcales bacterium]
MTARPHAFDVGPEIAVEIETLAPGGDAVGRQRDAPGAAT